MNDDLYFLYYAHVLGHCRAVSNFKRSGAGSVFMCEFLKSLTVRKYKVQFMSDLKAKSHKTVEK